MAPEEEVKPKKVSTEEFEINFNRLAVALAKRESLIKSWTASSSDKEVPSKTQEERDAEDALLFRNQPAYLGVGAPIPAHFLVSDASQDNKSLRAKFFPSKSLKASKARDVEEKAASAKRAKIEEGSDEEQGRSALGRAKKLKSKPRIAPVVNEDPVEVTKVVEEEVQAAIGSKKHKKVTPEREEPAKDEGARSGLGSKALKMITHEPDEPAQEVSKDETKEDIVKSSGDSSSPLQTSMEDIPMSDIVPTDDMKNPLPPSNSAHALDPKERKRMKKREKKRMRAKQKAAESGVKQN